MLKTNPSGEVLLEWQKDQKMWKHFPVHCQILKGKGAIFYPVVPSEVVRLEPYPIRHNFSNLGTFPCPLSKQWSLFWGGRGDAGPVTCTCASSGVLEVVVWTAFTSSCHSEGFIFPKKSRKKGGLVKRCKWDTKIPVQDCCCIRWDHRRFMRLYLSSLEGMIPIMVHRQGLSHPYHPRHVKRWDNIGVLNSPC